MHARLAALVVAAVLCRRGRRRGDRETRRGGADRTTTTPRSGKVTMDVDHPTADVTLTNSYG